MIATNVLAGLAIFLAIVWILRGLLVGNLGFCLFMIWNMILAAVPVLLLPVFGVVSDNLESPFLVPSIILLGGVWLLFLPNAFYLLTDLMHLNQKVMVNLRDNKFTPSLQYKRGDGLFILDSFLLMLATIFGAIMGGIGLDALYQYLSKNFDPLSYIVMGVVIYLCAIGVYIGRYGRWNSWDVFRKPLAILKDFFGSLRYKESFRNFTLVVITMIVFQVMSWLAVALY